MDFHLQFPIADFPGKVNYSHLLLFMGSCFAENISETMCEYKFNALINPHGILYNPTNISTSLRRYINNELITENELFFANECWNSWEHHSRFSHTDKENCLKEINNNISIAHTTLKNAEWLFITVGSAFIYKHIESNQFVANCHKQAQKKFTKHLLNTTNIIDDYQLLIQELKQFNKNLKIVFTVSPVRYVRDGVVENNISKARLIDAVHQLVEQNDNAYYFPAYELVIDDLRDYRFYKQDLVHPNEQAIEYVFDKLVDTLFDGETKMIFEKIKEIITAKNHRPFNTDSESHKKFKATYLERCDQLQKQYSFLNFEDEVNIFTQ
jgi:hypothetical protein